MKINMLDIIIVKGEIVQYLGFELSKSVVQDVRGKEMLIHDSYIDRKATKDEIKWFRENTKTPNFKTNP